ncbi:hypothetical protein [Ilumatobacter nonamiensis]|uniref:hypothetical protein n=1 Tax=Ilumatobacter nonamiensis TaxID=467093 RepID=UPI000348F9B9|nr:hypothetical protein [Ilumatobacter nonamiensis]
MKHDLSARSIAMGSSVLIFVALATPGAAVTATVDASGPALYATVTTDDVSRSATVEDDQNEDDTPESEAPAPETDPPGTEPADTTTDTAADLGVIGADPDVDGGDVAVIAVVGLVAVLGVAAWWMTRRRDPDDARSAPSATSDSTGHGVL